MGCELAVSGVGDFMFVFLMKVSVVAMRIIWKSIFLMIPQRLGVLF